MPALQAKVSEEIAAIPSDTLRPCADILAEANAAIEAGVHRGNPNANVIVWDWGWNDAHTPEIIAKLPKPVWLMSVSEWSLPLNRGGVQTAVGEYSISAVGPGPRATRHWALARRAGLRTVAKVQFNNTWELSAIPYLPALDLIAEHCSNLAMAGKVAEGWQAGLPELALAVGKAPPDRAADARAELGLAEAAQLHFASVANQARFTLARNALLDKGKPPSADRREALIREMRGLVEDELALARRLFTLAQQDSRIGYEASNHYYYVPLDLVEKALNCRDCSIVTESSAWFLLASTELASVAP